MRFPLSDVGILDLSWLLPGWFCSQLLADSEDVSIGVWSRKFWAAWCHGIERPDHGIGANTSIAFGANINQREGISA